MEYPEYDHRPSRPRRAGRRGVDYDPTDNQRRNHPRPGTNIRFFTSPSVRQKSPRDVEQGVEEDLLGNYSRGKKAYQDALDNCNLRFLSILSTQRDIDERGREVVNLITKYDIGSRE